MSDKTDRAGPQGGGRVSRAIVFADHEEKEPH